MAADLTAQALVEIVASSVFAERKDLKKHHTDLGAKM
jgi:hypothetical protein